MSINMKSISIVERVAAIGTSALLVILLLPVFALAKTGGKSPAALRMKLLAAALYMYTEPPTYRVVELNFIPTSINDRNEIVGRNGLHQPVLWSKGHLTVLSTTLATPACISGNGYIAGALFEALGGFYVQKSGQVSYPSSWFYSVNDLGVAVGNSPDDLPKAQAIEYRAGTVICLPDYGEGSVANGINAAGTVCGGVILNDGFQHLAVWRGGVLSDLGLFGNSDVFGWAINQRETIVGYATNYRSAGTPFVYENGVFTPYANPALTTEGALFAVNDRNEAVGSSDNFDTGPFTNVLQFGTYYLDHKLYMINDLLAPDPAGWQVLSARSINNRGWIVGTGIKNGGSVANFEGLLLIPLDKSRRP